MRGGNHYGSILMMWCRKKWCRKRGISTELTSNGSLCFKLGAARVLSGLAEFETRTRDRYVCHSPDSPSHWHGRPGIGHMPPAGPARRGASAGATVTSHRHRPSRAVQSVIPSAPSRAVRVDSSTPSESRCPSHTVRVATSESRRHRASPSRVVPFESRCPNRFGWTEHAETDSEERLPGPLTMNQDRIFPPGH